MLDGFDIVNSTLKRFIPSHILVRLQNYVVDTLVETSSNERWRKVILAYRSDAAFRETLAEALERAVQRFATEYEDKDLVDALVQSTRFWDLPSVRNALQEIVTRPSSYLQPEHTTLKRSFADVLPTIEPDRVERSVRFFLRCLTQEIMNIPQLAPIYQVQLHLASLEHSHQMVDLQRSQNQLTAALLEAVARNQLQLDTPAHVTTSPTLLKMSHNLPPQYGKFVGRDKDLEEVLEGLRSRWPLISIEGLGGIGKTTLALETAHRCLPGPQAVANPAFDYVVWVSAKDRPEQKLWLNEVLDTTARILGYPSMSNYY